MQEHAVTLNGALLEGGDTTVIKTCCNNINVTGSYDSENSQKNPQPSFMLMQRNYLDTLRRLPRIIERLCGRLAKWIQNQTQDTSQVKFTREISNVMNFMQCTSMYSLILTCITAVQSH